MTITQVVIDDERKVARTDGTDWRSKPGQVKLHFELINLSEEDQGKVLTAARDFRRIDSNTARVTGGLLVVWVDVSAQERQAIHGYVDATAGNLLRAIERMLKGETVAAPSTSTAKKTPKKGYRNGTGRGGRVRR